jgi:hypothetical protein
MKIKNIKIFVSNSLSRQFGDYPKEEFYFFLLASKREERELREVCMFSQIRPESGLTETKRNSFYIILTIIFVAASSYFLYQHIKEQRELCEQRSGLFFKARCFPENP